MARQSIHDKLGRVRPPRVHVTYKVETGDAIEVKELPFVMGVLGDFTGHAMKSDDPNDQPKALKERKFVEVTPYNFNDVLKGMKPHLALSVTETLSKDLDERINPEDPKAGKLRVALTFKELDDFDPDRVAGQVEPLRKLLETRQKLANLRGSLQGNDKLDDLLQEIVKDTEKARKLQAEMSAAPAGDTHE